MMIFMRTTLTIDDDLITILEQERKRKGMSFKEIVNFSLRRGLLQEHLLKDVPKAVTRPHAYGFRAGVDLDKLNQLADELEAEAFAAGQASGR